MTGLILAILGGGCLGFAVAWLIIRILPREKVREINYQRLCEEQEMLDKQRIDIEIQIQDLRCKKEDVLKEYDDYRDRVSKLAQQKGILEQGIDLLTQMQEEISAGLEKSRREAEKSAMLFKEQQLKLVEEQFDRATETIAIKYQQDEEEYKQHYADVVKDYARHFQTQVQSWVEECKQQEQILIEMRNTVASAIAAAKREEEKKQQKNFFRLVLPESDLTEITQLRAVEPYLRDKEALNKVIWKVYYEKPYTDLIGRVLGQKVKTGIYKITNMENQMCYVGQAVDVASRWKQHIKRGLGAETPTRNKLYPAMSSFGVENFTFELIEECEKEKLDEREDFWQEYFQAKEFGYSIK